MANLSTRKAHAARMTEIAREGQAFAASMTCPQCGGSLRPNNSLAGVTWLQCLTPESLPKGSGCGWQYSFDRAYVK